MSRSWKLTTVFAVAVLAATTLHATTLTPMSLRDMAVDADVIVHGTCVGLHPQRVGRSVVTMATIEVADTLKGNTTRKVTVALPGGVVPNNPVPVAIVYPGAPKLVVGEEAVLFFTRGQANDPAFQVVGFSQGKVDVLTDARGYKVVRAPAVDTVGPEGAAPAAYSYYLEDFKDRVRGLVREGAAGNSDVQNR